MKLKTKEAVIESLTKKTHGEFKELMTDALGITYEYGKLHAVESILKIINEKYPGIEFNDLLKQINKLEPRRKK